MNNTLGGASQSGVQIMSWNTHTNICHKCKEYYAQTYNDKDGGLCINCILLLASEVSQEKYESFKAFYEKLGAPKRVSSTEEMQK